MTVTPSSSVPVLSLLHNVIQNNLVGVPVIHEHTEWNFDPNDGLKRRVQYEALNGHLGEDLISRLGMSSSHEGPWGVKVTKVRPAVKYNL